MKIKCSFLNSCFKYVAFSRIKKCATAIMIVNGKAFHFKAIGEDVACEEIQSLYSNQEETYTRVVIYLKHAALLGYKSAIVRTPDSDIFFILLHHAKSLNITIYLDTGTDKHRKIIVCLILRRTKERSTALLSWGCMYSQGRTQQVPLKGREK